jgi:anti-anti-sigma factor
MTLTTPAVASEWQLEVSAMTTPAGIRLHGEVDISTLPTLDLALEILVDRALDATIELHELTFIDVCGLRALARAAIRLRLAGRCLQLRGASTQTRRVLSLLGWAELFEPLRDDFDECPSGTPRARHPGSDVSPQ